MRDHRVLSTVVIKVQLVSQSKKGDSTGPTSERFSRSGGAGWEGAPGTLHPSAWTTAMQDTHGGSSLLLKKLVMKTVVVLIFGYKLGEKF